MSCAAGSSAGCFASAPHHGRRHVHRRLEPRRSRESLSLFIERRRWGQGARRGCPSSDLGSSAPSRDALTPQDAENRRYSSDSLPRTARVKSDARSHASRTGKLVGRESHGAVSRRQTAREALERGDAIWVEWDGPDDPTNPFNWSRGRKWIVTSLCCWFTFLTAFCGSSFATNLLAIREDLGVSYELSLLSTAIYPLGFVRPPRGRELIAQGIAPLVTAPFSEVR